jgi:hypothetical protein
MTKFNKKKAAIEKNSVFTYDLTHFIDQLSFVL